ncbi:MAG: protocatechuate 3,4-dioxygenase [Pseudomonadota bacterium]
MATGLAAGSAAASPVWASLVTTPRQTSGPFYPLELPLDDDNDLTSVDGASVGATGEVIHVTGHILNIDGTPLDGARVELWQANAAGRYHHPLDSSSRAVDAGFQGFGHTITAGDGAYRFKTIRPGLYPGRTRHLHFAVRAPDGRELVTQMYFAGEPGNTKDGLLRRIEDPAQRENVVVDFAPINDGGTHGQFNMVLA